MNTATVERFNVARHLTDRGYRSLMSAVAARPKARMSNPVVGNIEDVINQPIYDSFSLAANAAFAKTTLFQQPVGQGGKTVAQTNMSVAGQLPFPQRLIVYSIRLFISNDTHITDMNNILRNVSVSFNVGVKNYFTGTPLFLTAGCGAIVTAIAQAGTAPAGTNTYMSTSNGLPDQRNVFALSKPIVIESGETFNMVFTPETAFNSNAVTTNPPGAGTTIYAILDGELYRQVQ